MTIFTKKKLNQVMCTLIFALRVMRAQNSCTLIERQLGTQIQDFEQGKFCHDMFSTFLVVDLFLLARALLRDSPPAVSRTSHCLLLTLKRIPRTPDEYTPSLPAREEWLGCQPRSSSPLFRSAVHSAATCGIMKTPHL